MLNYDHVISYSSTQPQRLSGYAMRNGRVACDGEDQVLLWENEEMHTNRRVNYRSKSSRCSVTCGPAVNGRHCLLHVAHLEFDWLGPDSIRRLFPIWTQDVGRWNQLESS